MANPYEAVMYNVVYGREAPEPGMGVEWLSKYVVRGFCDDLSRFEQAVEASAELEREADRVEIWRLRSHEAEQFRQASGRPVVTTGTGLVAELVAQNNGEGRLKTVPIQPPPPKDVSPFPGVHVYVR